MTIFSAQVLRRLDVALRVVESRSSSSLIFSSAGPGLIEGSPMPAIWRLRQSSSAFGAVV
jgi:hypothetical protein